MEKYYNEKGQVGVIISPEYGSGWSTYNDNNSQLVFDANLIEAVLNQNITEILTIAENILPNGYFSSVNKLEVVFLEPGTIFRIDEYDGFESIVIYNPSEYFTA